MSLHVMHEPDEACRCCDHARALRAELGEAIRLLDEARATRREVSSIGELSPREAIRNIARWFRENPRPNDAWHQHMQRELDQWLADEATPAVPETFDATPGPIIPTVTLSEAVRLAEITAEAVAHTTHGEAIESGHLPDRRKVPDNHVLELCEHVKKLAAALADAATEAECGHEMGGLAETICHRNGFRELREYVLAYAPEGDSEPF